jgi:hypothetical protein
MENLTSMAALITDLDLALNNGFAPGVLSLDDLWEVSIGDVERDFDTVTVTSLDLVYQGEEPDQEDGDPSETVAQWAEDYIGDKYLIATTLLKVEATPEEDWVNYVVRVGLQTAVQLKN